MNDSDAKGIDAAESAAPPSHGRMDRRDLAFIATLLLMIFVATYGSVMRALVTQWWTNETYSFGFLAPIISGYLIWLRRDHLARLPIEPAFVTGVAIILLAAALLVLGRVGAILALQELSLVLMPIGIVALVLGRRRLRALAFPLGYLFLALPVWEIVTNPLHRPSQLLSATIGTFLLKALGVPVHQQTVYVELPNITLEVGSICSGVNFLVAVVAIGVPQAYLYLRGWLPRVALVAGAVLIALLSNGVRVALIGLLAYGQFTATLHGPGHILTGLFVSFVGFAAIFAGAFILSRRFGRVQESRPSLSHGETRAVRRTVWAAALTAVVLMAAAGELQPVLTAPAFDRPPVASLQGGWRVVQGGSASPLISGGGSATTSRTYEASTGERIELSEARLAVLDPTRGLSYRAVQLPVTAADSVQTGSRGALRVNSAAVDRHGQQRRVVFWYDLGRSTTPDLIRAKADVLFRLLAGRPPTATIVLVSGPASDGGEAAIARFIEDYYQGDRN